MNTDTIASKYTYQLTWSQDDNEYVGLCVEFPSLSWLAPTLNGALKGIVRLVTSVLRDMKKNRETIPTPISERTYSGEFKVRIPPSVHRHLVLEAEEYSVSLNRLVSAKLAAGSR